MCKYLSSVQIQRKLVMHTDIKVQYRMEFLAAAFKCTAIQIMFIRRKLKET